MNKKKFLNFYLWKAHSNERNLSPEPDSASVKNSSSKNHGNTSESMGNNEFVSDSYDQDAISVDEIKSDLKQLNLDNKKVDGL